MSTNPSPYASLESPTGAAGGALTGTYPNPGLANVTIAEGGTGQTTANAAAVALGTLPIVASTAAAGYTLVNSTGDILTWTAPNDGAVHRFEIIGVLDVTSGETGGQIVVIWTAPDGTASGSGNQLAAGGRSTGLLGITSSAQMKANTAVTIHQQTAMSAGAAVLWADILAA